MYECQKVAIQRFREKLFKINVEKIANHHQQIIFIANYHEGYCHKLVIGLNRPKDFHGNSIINFFQYKSKQMISTDFIKFFTISQFRLINDRPWSTMQKHISITTRFSKKIHKKSIQESLIFIRATGWILSIVLINTADSMFCSVMFNIFSGQIF